MRVVIAGGGNVGTYIATELQKAGHQVLVVEVDPDRVARAKAAGEPEGVEWLNVDGCEVSSFAKAEPGRGRRRRRRHRRRRGQPRDLAAGQAGVRRSPSGRPGEQPGERVDVQRQLGRRRVGLDPAPAHRPGRGGRVGGRARPTALVRERPGAPVRGHPGPGLAGRGRRDPEPRSAPRLHRRGRAPPGPPGRAPWRHRPRRPATRCWCSPPSTPRTRSAACSSAEAGRSSVNSRPATPGRPWSRWHVPSGGAY